MASNTPSFDEAKIQEWLTDWCLFAEEAIGVTLDDEQKAILRSVQNNRMTSVASGTARGKDFIAAVAAMCFLYLVPDYDEGQPESTKVALTAPTDRQVGNIMFPEISKVYNKLKANGICPNNARLTGYDVRTDNKDYFLTGFKADEHQHEAWSGFHAVNTMFVVTEASGISENIFTAIEGNLQGNSRLLLVFNNNTGTGYAAASQYSSRFHHFRLDSLNAPNVKEKRNIIPGQVDWEWVNDKVKTWCTKIDPIDYLESEGDFIWSDETGFTAHYRPDDRFRVKVRGLAPKVAEDVLVPADWVEAANKRYNAFNETSQKHNKALRLGVDVAGMGRDSSAYCFRYGNYVQKFEMTQSSGKASHMEVAGKVTNILQANSDNINMLFATAYIDTIGEGAGVFSRLKEINSIKDYVYSVKFSTSAEWKGKSLKDTTDVHQFLNMRAYLYWCIRDWLNPANHSTAMLPVDNELMQELVQTKWKFRSDGKIQIEAKEDIKKRINRSPDKADALANTFYPANEHELEEVLKKRKLLNKLGNILR